MEQALNEQRTLVSLDIHNQDFFSRKEVIVAKVERDLQKVTSDWIGYVARECTETNSQLEN